MPVQLGNTVAEHQWLIPCLCKAKLKIVRVFIDFLVKLLGWSDYCFFRKKKFVYKAGTQDGKTVMLSYLFNYTHWTITVYTVAMHCYYRSNYSHSVQLKLTNRNHTIVNRNCEDHSLQSCNWVVFFRRWQITTPFSVQLVLTVVIEKYKWSRNSRTNCSLYSHWSNTVCICMCRFVFR